MMTIGELVRRHAVSRGNLPAYVDAVRQVDWHAFDRNSDSVGAALRALGVAPGERVAMIAGDCVEVAEVFAACAKIGAVRVGLNGRLVPRELAQLIEDCSPRVIVVQGRYWPLLQAALAQSHAAPAVIGFGDGHGAGLDYADTLARYAGEAPLPQTPHDMLMICYTTGSTGLPKGAIYRHEPMLRSIMAVALAEGANHDDVWLHAMPAAGVPIMHLMRNLVHGSKTVIVGDWDAERALSLIERERTTITVLVPTMLTSIITSGLLGRYDTSSMRQLGYGASPLPPAMVREAAKAFSCGLLQMYGSTELMGMSMMLFPSDHERGLTERPEILASAGRALPYADIRIVDDEGRDLPRGETGEVLIRTEYVTPGYWNAPEKYQEAVRDGWLYTGDMGRMDEEGYIYLGDRAKFRIKTGGYNVFPTEIENVLAEYPAVREVCVVGLPDSKWGERIHAVVSLRKGAQADPAQIREYCVGRIANFKIPKSIDIWDELPKGPTGKIQKRAVIDACVQKQD